MRQKSQSLSPSSGFSSSPLSSRSIISVQLIYFQFAEIFLSSAELSSFIINDPTSATSTTTLRTPTQPAPPMVVAYNKVGYDMRDHERSDT